LELLPASFSYLFYYSWHGHIIFAASFSSNGMGGGEVYKFDCSRGELFSGLQSFYVNNPVYQIPSKWEQIDFTKQPYYKEFKGISLYFKATSTEPEEMYFVTLVSNSFSDTTYTNPSYAAVRIVTDAQMKSIEITKEEAKRTDRRFKENVLDKLITDSCTCNVIGVRE
jgi:hypothetical protein